MPLRVFLAGVVLFVLLAFAPGSSTLAQADDCMGDPALPLLIEDAAACGGGTGMLGRWWSGSEGHYDCWFYTDWPQPHVWFVHDC